MRKIKFRAWDSVNQRYIPREEGTSFNDSEGAWPDEIIKITRAKGFDWEQFTGFHDAFLREIYEGDIVDAEAEPSYSDESLVSDIICAESGRFEVRTREKNKPYNEYQHGLELGWRGWAKLKIVGNIHENSDLLK